MRPLFFLLLLSPTLVSADVGFLRDAPRPAIGNQRNPQLVTANGVTWALWVESDATPYAGQQVMISRLDSSGGPVDVPAFTLPRAITYGELPSLAVCDGHVIVAWAARNPGTADRVLTAELLVGATGLGASPPVGVPPPANPSVSQRFARLVSGNGQCLLTWRDTAIRASRFVTSLLDSPPLTINVALGDAQYAFDGTQYVAVWTTGFSGALQMSRIDAVGVATAPVSVVASSGAFALAANAGATFLTWSNSSGVNGQWFDVTGATTSGPTVLDSNATSIEGLAATAFGAGFALAGANATSPARVFVATVNASAVSQAPVDVPLTVTAKRVYDVALTSNGTGLRAAFAQTPRPVDGNDVHAVALGAALQPVSPERIVSLAAPLQLNHFVTAIDSTALIGWTDVRWEDRGTSYSYVNTAFVGRLEGTGLVTDVQGIQVSTGANSNQVLGVSPDVNQFLVAWAETPLNVVWVRTVNRQTGALGAAHQVASGVTFGAFAGRAASHLLVAGGLTQTAIAQRVDSSGNTVGAAVMLPTVFRSPGSELVLTSKGSGWLLGCTAGATLYLQPIDASGQLGTMITRSWGNVVAEFNPTIGWNGTEWLVSWRSVNGGGCQMNLERFDASMNSLGTSALQSSGCMTDAIGLAFNGTNWITVMRDRLFDIPTQTPDGLDLQPIDTALQNDGGLPEIIQEGPGANLFPKLMALPQQRVLISYARRVNEAPYGTWRIRAKVWPSALDGGSSMPDAGVTVDAGTPVVDAGVPDAGLVDAGLVDAGLVDAGLVDAGLVDAGLVDAGLVDAGLVDAGVVDAGRPDAGMPRSDAGQDGADAGVPPGPTPSGCGCSSAARAPLALALLALLGRRKRCAAARRDGGSPR